MLVSDQMSTVTVFGVSDTAAAAERSFGELNDYVSCLGLAKIGVIGKEVLFVKPTKSPSEYVNSSFSLIARSLLSMQSSASTSSSSESSISKLCPSYSFPYSSTFYESASS